MPTVLVTGGCGFLGSHIVDELLLNNYVVRVLDKNIVEYTSSSDLEYIKFDLFENNIPKKLVSDCDIIIHLAAFSDLNAALDAPLDTVNHNVVATIKLLKLAAEIKINRFLFASTVYVYSQGGGFYKASKQACEVYIEEFHKRYGLDYTILRYGSLYGLRSDESNGIYRLINSALDENKIVYNGDENEKREYINVQDAARLTVETIDSKFINGNYVITGQQSITNADLITMFSEILNKELSVEYNKIEEDITGSHYKITPYTYLPKPGKKITPRVSVDMGQGLIQLIEEIQNGDKE